MDRIRYTIKHLDLKYKKFGGTDGRLRIISTATRRKNVST